MFINSLDKVLSVTPSGCGGKSGSDCGCHEQHNDCGCHKHKDDGVNVNVLLNSGNTRSAESPVFANPVVTPPVFRPNVTQNPVFPPNVIQPTVLPPVINKNQTDSNVIITMPDGKLYKAVETTDGNVLTPVVTEAKKKTLPVVVTKGTIAENKKAFKRTHYPEFP